MERSIYRSAAGREAILAAYDRRLAELKLPTESVVVGTRLGDTHLLVAGPEDGPPLLLVPGSGGSALDFAEALGSFADRHRCFFVDVPGEPNRSSEIQPDKATESLGRWMEQVLDALGLERVAMLGMSGGGFVVLKAAQVVPECIDRAVLLVPGGLGKARPLEFLRQVMWPLLRLRLRPSRAHVRSFLEAISRPDPAVSEAAVERMLLIHTHVASTTGPGPLFSAKDLARFEAPVLLVAGARDVIFPGDRVAVRARQVIKNLREVILLPGANHLHAGLVQGPVVERIREFLAEDAEAG